MAKLSHLDAQGKAKMVDVGNKPSTRRKARASGAVRMRKETFDLIREGSLPKGDVLSASRLAGIMAAKKTPDLIPLCHPILLSDVSVDLTLDEPSLSVRIEAWASSVGPTGVEMEALTAVAAAALTVYDMCKAVDREMVISEIMLEEKSGGRSGHYKRRG